MHTLRDNILRTAVIDDEIFQNHCNENAIFPVLLTTNPRHFLAQEDPLNQDGGDNGEKRTDANELAKSSPM